MSIQKICAGFETTLAAKLLAGGTSFALSSHLTKKGVELSGEYGFILGEGTAVEEWCYGTVISGVVTIIKRGLDPEDPNVEVTALKFDHDRGSSVKITDYPFLGFLREYFAGNTPLPAPLKYENHQTPTDEKELIDKKYADDLFSGAIGTASNSTAGGIKTDKANNGKPRTYQTLVQEQATPDMTLKVLPFKVTINEKIVDFVGGNSSAFSAPTTNSRIDLLVYDTAGSALAVRAGSENASPVAPSPTSGDIILAEIYHKVGETSVKEISDGTNGYISKWFVPSLYRSDLSLAASLPAYESLAVGDFIKTINDNGTYKVAKIKGQTIPVASSVAVNGSITKVEQLNANQLIVTTSTNYFYLADYDGTKITALTAFSAPSGSLQAVTMLDSQTVILSSRNSNTWSIRLATISGQTITYGTAITKNATYGGYNSALFRVSSTIVMFFNTEAYASNYGYSSVMITPITINGATITLGSTQTLEAGQYRLGAYWQHMVRISDTSFIVTTLTQAEDSGTGRYGYVYLGTLSGSTLTLSARQTLSSGTTSQTFSDALLRISDTSLLILFKQLSASDVLSAYYATISGTTLTLGSEITAAGILSGDSFVAFLSGQFITLKRSSDNKMFLIRFIKEIPSISNVSSNIYADIYTLCESLNDYLLTFSSDTTSKVGKFLFDHEFFVGIADKNYSVNENVPISMFYKSTVQLVNGGIYYLNALANGLTLVPNFKKLGRAISSSIIIKE